MYRNQPYPVTVRRRLVLPAPPEDLVGIDIVPTRHQRHRGTRRARLGNNLPLQCLRPAFALLSRRLIPGVHQIIHGHLARFTRFIAHTREVDTSPRSAEGELRRTLTTLPT